MLPVAFQIILIVVCGLHILLRRHRQPESRMAWLVVLIALPYAGALSYLLLGSTSVGRKRITRLRNTTDILPRPDVAPGWERYMSDSREISIAEVSGWNVGRRLWNNALAIVGPLL